MARTRIVFDKQGIRSLLKSPEIGTALRQIAQEVDTAAGGGYEVELTFDRRTSRAISMVKDMSEGARFREMTTGKLARAIGLPRTRGRS
jgi:hypothetical protein